MTSADTSSQSESTGTTAAPPVAAPGKRKYPILSLLTCAVCVIVFFGLASEQKQDSWEVFSKWGFLPADEIRQGKLWALVSSVFVHQALWHLVFNVYWLFVLGAPLERAVGSVRWLGLFVSAALVSSAAELTVSDTTGIGASGVVYALFGFMWVTRKRYSGFERLLDPRTILIFIVWLIGCVIASVTGVWSVGNAAHISGLLLGVGCAAWVLFVQRRRLIGLVLAILTLLSFIGFFWAPWSADWTSSRAVRAHANGDYSSAIRSYQRALKLGQDKVWCWENMTLVYYSMGDTNRYHEALETLRQIDAVAAKKLEAEISTPSTK
ncbi:MAG: rhomboid family intramembrane serine protease [Verrucomicrobia bacterium]|nr:MAG: rhomboid family intramembrane serine protease [Verrucomicrobiota bacterium]